MKLYTWTELSAAEQERALRRPDQRAAPEVGALVKRLFDDVDAEGEVALRRWALKLDGREPEVIEISGANVDAARAKLTREDIEAIDFAVDQVRFYHETTKPKSQLIEMLPGVRVRRQWRPVAT